MEIAQIRSRRLVLGIYYFQLNSEGVEGRVGFKAGEDSLFGVGLFKLKLYVCVRACVRACV